jgi:serine/threonine protein kinase/tetratricopeptide (TPR) repeat protein
MSEESLFHEALARPAAERAAFLDAACAGQPELRAAVEALLAAHEGSGSLLDRPPGELGQTVDPESGQPLPVVTTNYHPNVEPGLVIAGRYTLVEKIGEGGMGEVWVAKQTEPVKRKVALKLIKAGMDSKAVLARFEAERQALALMDHPNIARVLDGGMTADGRPFFVMELVNGLPLTKFCDELKLTPKERLELFVPICQAVQHAHQKGIVHRDLKPANILVTMIDARPVPKVIDFGVAKATAGKLTDESLSTQFGAVVGTLEYMAPEQAGLSGEDIDTRADIYSLGVILYELLTGLRPIDAKRLKKAALTEMVRILREEEPSRPSKRLSTDEGLPSLAALRQTEPRKLMALLRGELDWVVMKCLEKHRDRRYETANGLARDVQRYLADEPVEARPPSAGYRLSKFLKRHRGLVLAAGLVLLALLVGLAGTIFGLVRAEERRQEADNARTAEAEQRLLAEAKQREAQTAKEKALQAAAKEKAALEQTQRRLQQIEKGVDLLASLLTGINPRNEEKGGPTLYEQLLQRASKALAQLHEESVGDKLAVARLQSILGNTLRELGDPAGAVTALEKAGAILERELGQDHPDTLFTRNNLAMAYQRTGQVQKAIEFYEVVLQAQEARLGKNNPDTLKMRNNLALAYQAAGRPEKAIPLFETALQSQEAKLGQDHPDTLICRNNLALAYQSTGQLAKAITLYERTLQSQENQQGQDHPDTLIFRNNLATAYQESGQLDKAIPLYERNLRAQEAKLGPDHPNTLSMRNNLATAYHAAGQLTRAIGLLKHNLQASEARWGKDHPNTLTLRNNLAGAYKAAGDVPKAISLYERTLQAEEAALGPDHPETILSRNNLATAYQDGGQLQKALPLFEQAAVGVEQRHFQHDQAPVIIARTIAAYEMARQLDRAEAWRRKWLEHVRQQAGDTSPAYAAELAMLGVNLLQQHKWADAEATLRQCLAIRTRAELETWTTFNTQSLLGASLLGQKKYAEAEPLLLMGYDGMRQRQKTIPSQGKLRLTEAAERLAQLYEATNKKDQTDKWRQVLAELKVPPKVPEKKP